MSTPMEIYFLLQKGRLNIIFLDGHQVVIILLIPFFVLFFDFLVYVFFFHIYLLLVIISIFTFFLAKSSFTQFLQLDI